MCSFENRACPGQIGWSESSEEPRSVGFFRHDFNCRLAQTDLFIVGCIYDRLYVYPMTDPYVCHIWCHIYHQYTPVLLASIYHTYGSVMGMCSHCRYIFPVFVPWYSPHSSMIPILIGVPMGCVCFHCAKHCKARNNSVVHVNVECAASVSANGWFEVLNRCWTSLPV